MTNAVVAFLILFNLTTLAGLAIIFGFYRHRDLRMIRQNRQEAERNLKEAVGLFDQMYKVLSKEIQELRQENEPAGAPTLIHSGSGSVDKRYQVLTLAGRGLDLDEIAARTNVPKGEAELILSLNRLKRQAIG